MLFIFPFIIRQGCCLHGVDVLVGTSLWINGDGGATPCDADTIGILPHGIRILPAISAKWKPKKPVKPIVHFPGVAFSGKHGVEAETDKDSHFFAVIAMGDELMM